MVDMFARLFFRVNISFFTTIGIQLVFKEKPFNNYSPKRRRMVVDIYRAENTSKCINAKK